MNARQANRTGTLVFLVRTGHGFLIEFVRRSARGTAQLPFTSGRGVSPLVSPGIAGRRYGFRLRSTSRDARRRGFRSPLDFHFPRKQRGLFSVLPSYRSSPFARLEKFPICCLNSRHCVVSLNGGEWQGTG